MGVPRLLFLGRLAARNALRHKAQTVRAVLGLLVATVILSAGLGLGESVSASFDRAVLARFGAVDVTLAAQRPFDAALADALPQRAGLAGVEGSGTLHLQGAVSNPRAGLAEPAASVRGVSPREAQALGPLRLAGGGDAPEPGAGEVVVSEDLARAVDARVGDTLVLRTERADAEPGAPRVVTMEARVVAIVENEGRAALTRRPTALVPLDDLQRATGAMGQANAAYYAVSGDARAAVRALAAALPEESRAGFRLEAAKAEAIEEGRQQAVALGAIVIAMGSFTLLAAGLLAFTLFGAIVEERRAEIGIARALGLTRGEVALAMTLEGALYSFAAAVVGVALGVALVWGVGWVASDVLAVDDVEAPEFTMRVSPGTLVAALAAGTLFPLLTIGVASRRFARLDPSRAIRGVPDDPRETRRRGLWLAAILVAGGGLLSVPHDARPVGVPVLLAGAALALAALRRPRLAGAAAAAGFAFLAWALYAFPFHDEETDLLATFACAAILALGLAAVAVSSRRPYEALLGLVARRPGPRRSVYVGIRYLVARRRPVGFSMAMIALVVVIVTPMGMLLGAVATSARGDVGGYEVLGASAAAHDDLPAPLPADVAQALARADLLPRHEELRPARFLRDGEPVEVADGIRSFLGATPAFAQANGFALRERAGAYPTDGAAWAAVAEGEAMMVPWYALENERLRVGERIRLETASAPAREYVVAGGFDPDSIGWQAFVAADDVRAMGPPQSTLVFVRAAEGADPTRLAHQLADVYAEHGLAFTSVPEARARERGQVEAAVLVIEAFLALGLFVGLAATGFLASRAVHERMRDIGTLRALGYEEADVRRAFLLESGLTAGVGLLLGALAGLLVAHGIWWRHVRPLGLPFEPPWPILGGMTVAVLAIAALASAGPARRASRLAPAIAVRHVE